MPIDALTRRAGPPEPAAAVNWTRAGFVLWVLYFCYATSAALLFQKALLPRLPGLHAGFGLLDGDSYYFHTVAVDLAARIRDLGWGEWSVFPAIGATGNVAILAALYAVFGNDPSLIVPINAALHAFGGVLLFLIGRRLLPTAAGSLGGLVAGTLFVVFPTALNWYGQVHKDGYAITGVLLLVWAWLRIQGQRPVARDFWIVVAATVTAMLLIAFVRPYNLLPVTVVMFAAFGVLVLVNARQLGAQRVTLAICAASLALLGAGAALSKKVGVDERYSLEPGQALDVGAWQWKRVQALSFLPKPVDEVIESVARTRIRFMEAGRKAGAGSMIDLDAKPGSIVEVVAYMPRALQIAMFSPFPDRWLEKRNLPHLIAMLETLTWYLVAPGVLLCLLYASPARALLLLSVAILFLIIYGVTTPNVGTLYRIRSPYLFLLIVMGVVGWMELLRRHAPAWVTRIRLRVVGTNASEPGGTDPDAAQANVLGAGAIVGILTALTFFGLFARDAILARWFGTGEALDAYFVAIALPSFLIAAISIPLGTVLTAQFLEARHRRSEPAAQALVSRIGGLYATAMLAIVAVLVLAAGPLLRLFGSELAPGSAALARVLFYWMLPILALSGFVIIGNAILNALGDYALPASAQLVVPAMSIAAILLAGPGNGVVAAIGGMLAGQVLNLWIVARALARRGISVAPRWGLREPLRDLPVQYAAVVAAALLTNLAAPVNLAMASTLASGAATWGLGSKVMTFVAGIIAAAMATVVLPRFAAIMAQRRLIDLRDEFSFLLVAATVLTIPMALFLFVGSEILVRVAFGGGAFGEESVAAVARVMRFGIVQLPFLTVNLLILKFAIAARAAGWVFVASLIALGINVALNLALMPTSGVAGIALASTVGVALSTFFMLLLFRRLGHVSWMDVLMLTLNWMPYMTFAVCLHYRSYAGVVVSILAMLVLFAGHLGTLARGRHGRFSAGAAPTP